MNVLFSQESAYTSLEMTYETGGVGERKGKQSDGQDRKNLVPEEG